jgi:hypothetical protein
MARKKTHDGDEPDYATEPDGDSDAVTVEIVVDHIYLPLDGEGNVPATWAEAPDTVRVGKGTKLAVPADILEMLGDRVARVA